MEQPVDQRPGSIQGSKAKEKRRSSVKGALLMYMLALPLS